MNGKLSGACLPVGTRSSWLLTLTVRERDIEVCGFLVFGGVWGERLGKGRGCEIGIGSRRRKRRRERFREPERVGSFNRAKVAAAVAAVGIMGFV